MLSQQQFQAITQGLNLYKKTFLVSELPPEPPAPVQHIRRRMVAAAVEFQREVDTEYGEATKQTCNVTGDTVSPPIVNPNILDTETGMTDGDLDVMSYGKMKAMKNINGMDELMDIMLLYC